MTIRTKVFSIIGAGMLALSLAANWPECGEGSPYIMARHFFTLVDYYNAVEQLSPIGAIADDDFTFYASGWLFVRWAIDQTPSVEADFVRDLVGEPVLSGVANIVARAGRSYPELLADFSLALAADDDVGAVGDPESDAALTGLGGVGGFGVIERFHHHGHAQHVGQEDELLTDGVALLACGGQEVDLPLANQFLHLVDRGRCRLELGTTVHQRQRATLQTGLGRRPLDRAERV